MTYEQIVQAIDELQEMIKDLDYVRDSLDNVEFDESVSGALIAINFDDSDVEDIVTSLQAVKDKLTNLENDLSSTI